MNNVLHSHHFSVTFCHQQKPGRLVTKFLISPKTLFFCRWRRVLFTWLDIPSSMCVGTILQAGGPEEREKTWAKSAFALENIRKHCDILPCSRIRKHKSFFLGPSTRSSLESLERFSPEKLFVILDVVLCATKHGYFYHWHWSLKGWQWNRNKFTIRDCDCYHGFGIYTPGVSVGVFSGRESWLRGSPPTTQYLSLLWIGQNND